MGHRNETCGWHVCAGRVKHAAHLDLAVARTGPHDGGAGRVADAPGGGPEVGEHAPEGNNNKTYSSSCGEALRQKRLREQERPVDCGDRTFRRQGLARAQATARERIGGARRRNHARRPSTAGEVRK